LTHSHPVGAEQKSLLFFKNNSISSCFPPFFYFYYPPLSSFSLEGNVSKCNQLFRFELLPSFIGKLCYGLIYEESPYGMHPLFYSSDPDGKLKPWSKCSGVQWLSNNTTSILSLPFHLIMHVFDPLKLYICIRSSAPNAQIISEVAIARPFGTPQ